MAKVKADSKFKKKPVAAERMKCPFVPVGTKNSFNIYLGNSKNQDIKFKPSKQSLHSVQRTVSMKAKHFQASNRKRPVPSSLTGEWKTTRTPKANYAELITRTPKNLITNSFSHKMVTSTQLKNTKLQAFTLPNDTSPEHISNTGLFNFKEATNFNFIKHNGEGNVKYDHKMSPLQQQPQQLLKDDIKEKCIENRKTVSQEPQFEQKIEEEMSPYKCTKTKKEKPRSAENLSRIKRRSRKYQNDSLSIRDRTIESKENNVKDDHHIFTSQQQQQLFLNDGMEQCMEISKIVKAEISPCKSMEIKKEKRHSAEHLCHSKKRSHQQHEHSPSMLDRTFEWKENNIKYDHQISPSQQQQQLLQDDNEEQCMENSETAKQDFMLYSRLDEHKIKAEMSPPQSMKSKKEKPRSAEDLAHSRRRSLKHQEHSPLICEGTFESKEENNTDKPSYYLSPFVSVARGKVNRKIEQSTRNSVYNLRSMSLKENIEDVRTLESVRYHRKQLQDEIQRLNSLCEEWETYKANNLKQLEEVGGDDMIDVTIGQTRLLIGKKFMQFKGLIDRCENFVSKNNEIEDDGTEATKLVTAIDLEGFWAMLGLQIDNLEKRFDNLNRWKSNNWLDPDEIKPKTTKIKQGKKPKPIGEKKPTATSAFIRMLRQKQLELRKNSSESQMEQSPIATAKFIVKDRKYYSPSPTILTMQSPANRCLQGSAKHRKLSLIRQ